MGNIGDPITPSIPTVGSGGPGYATSINAILAEVVTRLSNKVPISSLSLSGTLDMGGNPITNAGYLGMTALSATPGASPALRLTTFGGDLYYVSPTGAIQVTSGNQLNAAAIGGITGAYGGANPAQFRYDNVNSRYDAYANFGTNTWADVRALGFDIAAGATSTVFARLLFAGASNKTYTLPVTTASANDRPMYMNTSGQITLGHGAKSFNYGMGEYGLGSGFNIQIHADGGLTDQAQSGFFQAYKAVDGLPQDFVIDSFTSLYTNLSGTSVTVTLKKVVPGGTESTLATNTSTAAGTGLSLGASLGAPDTVGSTGYYRFIYSAASGAGNSNRIYGFTITGHLPG